MTYRVPRRRHTAEHSGLAQKNPSPNFSLIPAGILRVAQAASRGTQGWPACFTFK